MRKGKKNRTSESITHDLQPKPLNYIIYGKDNIEQEALQQMDTAMRLPITCAGALMPDAHTGYGLPIGGVLATESNFIIPYAVGVDIACRMCMTVYEMAPEKLINDPAQFKKLLWENTVFGVGSECLDHIDESLFDKDEWHQTKPLKELKDKAYSQLGTSGSGNHFVDWGILEVTMQDDILNIPVGKYIAVLSHSGSRGFGENIAKLYSNIAMSKTILPGHAGQLAWLDMRSEEGQEYWLAMNLAGEYASANHKEIHDKISKALGLKPLRKVENHHNFAWKEKLPDGTEVLIHRKGATPAGKNNIGIIPGSMTQPGFIVRGKGNSESLNSAAHGAGRVMSRTKAFQNIQRTKMDYYLKEHGVELLGGDVDEAPMVYKDIYNIMDLQSELVDILAKFTPKIVRMSEPEKWKRRKH